MDIKDFKLSENEKTGLLLNADDIKLHRIWFRECCDLHGITCLYYRPKEGSKTYSGYGELEAFFEAPMKVRVIFQEHVPQWTARKLGWNSELQEQLSLIEVPYDLPGIQKGCLFVIPSGIDNSEGRVFKVVKPPRVDAVYPASITLEIGPVMINTSQQAERNLSSSRFTVMNVDDPNSNRNDDL